MNTQLTSICCENETPYEPEAITQAEVQKEKKTAQPAVNTHTCEFSEPTEEQSI